MGFGGPLFCSSVLAFLVFNVDNFAIGAILARRSWATTS